MMVNYFDWFLRNWRVVVPIVLSLMAIIFTALKDFILPWIIKPKLKVSYFQKEPYNRQIFIGSDRGIMGFYYRFKVKNIGRDVAKNCRCQIYSIQDLEGNELDLRGFPIRWASRPEPIVDFIKAERLNIGPGESEFADLTHTNIHNAGYFYFEPYHNVPIGMNNQVPLKDYLVTIIISGDNFRPYLATFEVNGSPKEKHILEITLKGVKRK